MRAALCVADTTACDTALYVTSNSGEVLSLVDSLAAGGALYTRNASFRRHSSPADGYEAALLELAVLSSATAIVGTAGSSFAAEAARIGDVKWYTQRDWGPSISRMRRYGCRAASATLCRPLSPLAARAVAACCCRPARGPPGRRRGAS